MDIVLKYRAPHVPQVSEGEGEDEGEGEGG